MKINDFLVLLDQPYKSGRGWVARCPAHADHRPSLSIRSGYRGILLRCWAGCSLDAVCGAVGIRIRDLFYDNRPYGWMEMKGKSRSIKWRIAEVKSLQADLLWAAEQVILTASGLDICRWTETELDSTMVVVCRAHKILLTEEMGAANE